MHFDTVFVVTAPLIIRFSQVKKKYVLPQKKRPHRSFNVEDL